MSELTDEPPVSEIPETVNQDSAGQVNGNVDELGSSTPLEDTKSDGRADSIYEDFSPFGASTVGVVELSPEHGGSSLKVRAVMSIYIGLFLIFGLACAALLVFKKKAGITDSADYILAFILGALSIASLFGGIANALYLSSKTTEAPTDAAAERLDPTDPVQLARQNQRLLNSYHAITTTQARTSYRNSQIAMAIGFVILVVGALTVIRAQTANAQLVLGALTGLGSAFTAYLSATFLGVHYRAQEQMKYFYGQPLVQSYLLIARSLSRNLSTEKGKDETLRAVIKSALEGARMSAEAVAPSEKIPSRSLQIRRKAGTPQSGAGQ